MKILIAGGSGAGKTAFLGAVSEIGPLRTEELVPCPPGAGTPVGAAGPATVAVDLGRITIGDDLVLYLFGAAGHVAPVQRGAKRDADARRAGAAPFWEDLASGAIGAVVLADTARLADCVPSIDFFRRRGTPFLVAVTMDGAGSPQQTDEAAERIRRELRLDADVPIVGCDVRDRRSGREVLVTLVQHAGQQPRQRVS